MTKREHPAREQVLLLGLDIGSTTTKGVVVTPWDHQVLFSSYRRHHADQAGSLHALLEELAHRFPDARFRPVMTGSGAKKLAEELELPFVQEVVANSIALKEDFPQVRTAIELGGQDAKMIFFRPDPATGSLNVADMRMNGSCAGGTGAFLDEMAAILKVPVEEFDQLARAGTCVYDISGRCGVYAKTDIQPLLNQGAAKEDLALSALHAIAKQTIGGLAQGLDIKPPVAFEGGPLTFQPTLIRVFAQRLGLKERDILIPRRPETIMAYGAALSLESLFAGRERELSPQVLLESLQLVRSRRSLEAGAVGTPFFPSPQALRAFQARHASSLPPAPQPARGQTVDAYLGIDSGSTTIKFVLLDEEERLLDSFYAPNEGDPLHVAQAALLALRDKYRQAGVTLKIQAAGTTGYGEMLFFKAFHTECHVVETVAHARATGKYVPDATFILDIGGQDMKALWLDQGVITNIVVNEACSSGCGSFLENFAASMGIPVNKIASMAFASAQPAVLGSRCTVFMNSSIITEQRNGKLPQDIMAGLCRSIIENVFTKVIRLSNLDSLGNKIVVQGGTFQNDAVLRAMEQYIGREVIRAPYAGLMGAIGAALAAKEQRARPGFVPTFLGLDALETFSCQQQSNVPCPFCGNHCRRSVVTFSTGGSWVTNNRCPRGEILGDPKSQETRELLRRQGGGQAANLFALREKLLFASYPLPAPPRPRDTVIGLPRVLAFWDTMPFWTTFWRSLGFQVRLSRPSSRKMYESGLSAVTSDTVCFPAKLVHGHIRDLVSQKVDRIFLPSITVLPSENTQPTSISMCAVVKGYPLVLQNSDDPQRQWGIPFDHPLFHWYTREDREKQLALFMEQTFQIPRGETAAAIAAGDQAQASFRRQLKQAGAQVLEQAEKEGRYAVVLASRPYQNDPLVNHDLPAIITQLGVPVVTADSLPGVEDVDLSRSRIDVVNNFHARMLGSAVMAASRPNLEYIQLVSFGCGHDAYLSDEIQRMMKEISGKIPLILKVDESDVQGPLRIRVRSFLETVDRRRAQGRSEPARPLADPYPVKFTRKSRREKIVLVPNTSHAFSRIMAAALSRQGVRTVPLAIGREEAIRLGKEYVHNDICFPAQIVIGEALAALKSGTYDNAHVAVAMGKYIGDCRLTHYGALLRKALDDAGYPHVPILTNDDTDYHNLHPGFHMGLPASLAMAFALPMIDVLEELLRKIRPYELVPNSANLAFEKAMDQVVDGLRRHGVFGARRGFVRAMEIMNQVAYDRSRPRPQVLIVGEYLLNFHPGANHDIEDYLEQNGFEVIEARMTDVIRKTYFCQRAQVKEYKIRRPAASKPWLWAAEQMFQLAHALTDSIARSHPLYQPATRLPQLAAQSDPIIPHTFDAGEGILIPGEILHHAQEGCRAFVILQPFGCLPNHVVGRGVTKKLKELYPDAQILPLDYDPDVSFANIENRLQMLIMNAKQASAPPREVPSPARLTSPSRLAPTG